MSSAKLMFLLVLWLLVSRTYCARKDGVYGDGVSTPSDCQNCSICPYPCHPQSPPPPPGYPSSGAPPPPAATGNCPPTSAGCCQYPQPSPPSPYTYVPYNNYSASPPMPLSSKSPVSILFTIVILFGFVSLHLV
ncbi:vegetative cell wall protein gp1 [Vitis vinifera]|uniref:Uncharacterized protein n=1 Tax=Vitis vinifera TaxID=29760 RepID=A5BJQ0_VITVI|nr:vegetative cell wall protein gp1 [Vitis vinifera]CAN72420.1 hypothetical protein VITISV_043891 [Vitis vinifera]|eukprot:XP_010657520.1 PREDICTED: vegetative cell wall protein gp1 [Vitis vinifera]